MNTRNNWRKTLYLSVGFLAGVLFLTSCGGGSTAIAEYIGIASDIIFDSSTNSLVAEDVQVAIEQVNAKADVNQSSLSDLNSRQILTDVDDGNLFTSPYDTDIPTGMSIEVSGRGRDMMVTASINVDNILNGLEANLIFKLNFDGSTRRTEVVSLAVGDRQLVTIQWLERNVTTGTHTFDVDVSSTSGATLRNRYFYCIEL